MATVPTLDTFTAGEVVTAAKLNKNIRDTGNYLVARPMCQLSANAAQSFATSGSYATAVLNVVDVDTDSMADLANNRIVIKTAGLYRITGGTIWATNSTGIRYTTIKDGAAATIYAFGSCPGGTSSVGAIATRMVRLAVNDTLILQLLQNSGGALSTGSPFNVTHLAAEWISA